MKQFAIYFIPSNINFYKTGSEIIGYDIINGLPVRASKNKHVALAQKLNSQSRKYGFHLTITDVVNIDEIRLNEVIQRAKLIFNLPIFRNIMLKINKIDLMPNANAIAIQYQMNFALLLLHILLIIFVQKLGSRSDYSSHTDDLNFFRRIKTKLFLSPYILDDFLPHITLVQNFSAQQHDEILRHMSSTFLTNKLLHIRQIAIVVRDTEKNDLKILELLNKVGS